MTGEADDGADKPARGGRGGRGGDRGRGGRGAARGPGVRADGQERQSRGTHFRPEKREGAGRGNWGSNNEQAEEAVAQVAGPEATEPATPAEAPVEGAEVPAVEQEALPEEPKTLSLDEYLASKA